MRALILACSVCFGDPNSLLSKGAFWGVVVLVAFVSSVLAAILTTSFIWSRRARKSGG